jgi:hypothetical protein
VPGDEGRLLDPDPELGSKGADHGEAHRHQGRLSVLGEGELGLRTLPHEAEQGLAEDLVHLLEHLARRGEGLGQGRSHADDLAALARKNKGEAHSCSFPHAPCDPARRFG